MSVGEARGVEFAAGLVRDLCGDPGAGGVAGSADGLPVVGRLEQRVTGAVSADRRTVVVKELPEARGDVAEGCVEEVQTRSQTVATDTGSARTFNR